MWSPKKRFIEAATSAKAWVDGSASTPFRDAAEAALLQMIADMPEVTDQVQAIAGYHRIMGARTFIRHLAEIANPASPPPAKTLSDNLIHT